MDSCKTGVIMYTPHKRSWTSLAVFASYSPPSNVLSLYLVAFSVNVSPHQQINSSIRSRFKFTIRNPFTATSTSSAPSFSSSGATATITSSSNHRSNDFSGVSRSPIDQHGIQSYTSWHHRTGKAKRNGAWRLEEREHESSQPYIFAQEKDSNVGYIHSSHFTSNFISARTTFNSFMIAK